METSQDERRMAKGNTWTERTRPLKEGPGAESEQDHFLSSYAWHRVVVHRRYLKGWIVDFVHRRNGRDSLWRSVHSMSTSRSIDDRHYDSLCPLLQARAVSPSTNALDLDRVSCTD